MPHSPIFPITGSIPSRELFFHSLICHTLPYFPLTGRYRAESFFYAFFLCTLPACSRSRVDIPSRELLHSLSDAHTDSVPPPLPPPPTPPPYPPPTGMCSGGECGVAAERCHGLLDQALGRRRDGGEGGALGGGGGCGHAAKINQLLFVGERTLSASSNRTVKVWKSQ